MTVTLIEGLSRRPLKTGKVEITKKMLKGAKPSGVLWADWFAAGGTSKPGQTAKPKKLTGQSPQIDKPKSYSPMAHFNQKALEKHTEPSDEVKKEIQEWYSTRSYVSSSNWIHNLKGSVKKGKVPKVESYTKEAPGNWKHLKRLGLYHFVDKRKSSEKPKQWWEVGVASGSKPSWSSKPRTPEQIKLDEMLKAVRKHEPIKRDAAGGLVIQDWHSEHPLDLQVLVAQTHKKWGGYWVLPKGGVDKGESLHQGAEREVREEAGVKAKVAVDRPFSSPGWSGSQADYDVERVVELLEKQFPKEKKFIESQLAALKKIPFKFSNTNHYYVMNWVSGKPLSRPDPHQEMQKAEWVTLREARKMGGRIKTVADKLMPIVERLWEKANGKPVPPKQERVRTPRGPKETPAAKRSISNLLKLFAKSDDELDW